MVLSGFWFLLQPLASTFIFTVVFVKIANIPTDGVPQPLFYMGGIVTWNYFASCLNRTSDTFVANEGIFGKVYFPRLAVPLSAVIINLLTFAIQFALFLAFMVFFGVKGSDIHPNIWILFTPLLILQMGALGLGLGILISSLATKYRDLSFVLGFGVQLWMYATPVVYTNFHLVLIDDGSTDGTEQMVRSLITDLTVITGKGDWWWAGALQQGYLWLKKQAIAANDVVLIINDDTEIGPEDLTTGREIIRDNPHSLLVTRCYDRQTAEMVDPGTYHIDVATRAFRTVDGDGEINCSSTRGLFLRVADMFSLGGFYPWFLPHYLSDIEYTYRAYRKGIRIVADERLKLSLDHEATGYHELDDTAPSRLMFLKNYFSNKSMGNPVRWTNFVLLAFPWHYWARHLFNIWKSALQILIVGMFRGKSRQSNG